MEKAVMDYVLNGIEAEKREILKYPNHSAWEYLKTDRIVYRGQKVDDKSPDNMILFSTTTEKEVARKDFAGKEGCVWTITLSPGVKILDVGKLLGDYKSSDEKEILVVGKGHLDYKKTKESPCEYTARYSVSPPPPPVAPAVPVVPQKKPVTYAMLRKRIPDDEIELFGEPTKEELRKLIQPNEYLVEEGGKRKKTKRHVKHRRGKKSRGGLKRVSK